MIVLYYIFIYDKGVKNEFFEFVLVILTFYNNL